MVEQLTGGGLYRLSVAAVDVSGAGPASSVVVTVNGDLPLPLPPVSVTATPGNGVVTVTWTVVQQPATANYTVTSQVTSCALVCSSCGDPTSAVCTVAWDAADEATMSCNVTGVTDGVAYVFRASCCNDAGVSSLSTPSQAVIPYSGVKATPGAPPTPRVTAVARFD